MLSPLLRSSRLRVALALATGILGLHTAASAQTAATPDPQTAATPDPQTAPVGGDTIRLSDEQRDLILDRNTVDSAAAARGEMSGSQRSDLRIHGEVGAMIGSNGSRAIFGRADIPLGENAGATVMFEHSRFDYRR